MIDFAPELRRRIEAEISRQGAAVAGGAASDHADYKSRCGEIRGLTAALKIADDIQQAINEE